MNTPANAAGTDPTDSHATRPICTVPRRKWTAPPNGFMIADATMSLETAALGVTPNSRMRIGVISAPPPAPVMPTSTPTIRPAMTMSKLTRASTQVSLGRATAGACPSGHWDEDKGFPHLFHLKTRRIYLYKLHQ